MSNIQYNCISNEAFWFTYYKSILQKYISKVMQAINETDSGITWIICKERDLPNNPYSEMPDIMEKVLGKTWFPQYGRSDTKTRKIWISKDAIQEAAFSENHFSSRVFFSIFPQQKQREQLAEIIIDEYTHIKTNANHGETKYDNQYLFYIRKYYGLDTLQNLLLSNYPI